MKEFLKIVILISVLLMSAFVYGQDKTETIRVSGFAVIDKNNIIEAKNNAVKDAQTKAIEQGIGVFISRKVIAENYEIKSDVMTSYTKGFIKTYKIIDGTEQKTSIDGCEIYTLEIEALVMVDYFDKIKEHEKQEEKGQGVILANLGYSVNTVKKTVINKYNGVDCSSFTHFIIDEKITSVQYGALKNTDNITFIYIGKNVREIDIEELAKIKGLSYIAVDKDNKTFADNEGVLYNRNKTRLIFYPAGKTDLWYGVPRKVVRIDDNALRYNKNLLRVYYPMRANLGKDVFPKYTETVKY